MIEKMNIDQLIIALQPYMDKVVINPLSQAEVSEIQSRFKKRIPEYFKEFLLKIGLKQDLVWGILDATNRFEDLGDFLPSDQYFQFSDNGGEDYYLLKFDDEQDRTIYEYEYYKQGTIVSRNKTFDELLLESFYNLRERYDKFPLKTEKVWWVDISINTSSPSFLITQLQENSDLNIKLIKPPTKNKTETDQQKPGIISINGTKLPLLKGVYSGLTIVFLIPVEEMKENSLINQLDQALKPCVFKHSILDHGFINRKELDFLRIEE